jgi:MerR family copper efflux transcriptional regulator
VNRGWPLDLQVDLKVYPRGVPTPLRIADVARQSGFTAATLRYYEEIGLLPPPQRSDAGYRLYDDTTLERLAFINRAKRLGCTLEEIAELSIAWNGGRCGPVQDRLRSVVATKLADAEARIVELRTLTAELQEAAAALARHRPEGPCDDQCGCTTGPERNATPVAFIATPPPVRDAEIACTLDAEAVPGRMEDWNRLLGLVTGRSALADGVRVELDPGVRLEEVARLTAAEQECCQFFAFALTVDGRGVGLEIRAADDALPLVHALFGAPA